MITINGRFLTQNMTGTQRYAHEVARRLVGSRGGEGVRLVMPKHEGPLPEELSASTLQMGRLQGHPWEQLELGGWANRGGGVLWSPVNVGPVNARDHVVTIHDVFSIKFPQWVGRRFHLWYSFLLPRIASSARHIITVSDYSKEAIIDALGVAEDKVSVVYEGVDTGFAVAGRSEMSRVRQKYGLPEDFILTLGSLEPRKNLERVVDAWLRLDEKSRPPLVIAGGLGVRRVFGSYDTEFLRRHKGIRLLGYVPEGDLPALYAAATMFVYASLLEGFGLPPLEAIACGATVVTSDTSAMKEVSGGMAILAAPDSTHSIADGMTEAMETKQAPADREHRSRVIKERFDWAGTADQVGGILERYE